jgi:hypothetical protein
LFGTNRRKRSFAKASGLRGIAEIGDNALTVKIDADDPKETKTPRQPRPKCCGATTYLTLSDGAIVVEHEGG